MYRKIAYFLILSVGLLPAIATAARTAPIYNVEGVAITPGPNVTMEKIGQAMVRAGGNLGWQMKRQGNGHIIGTLHVRKHTAIVDIKYTPKSYSIVYKDSVNLNAEGGQIHRNYNSWIQNLDRAIQAQLSTL